MDDVGANHCHEQEQEGGDIGGFDIAVVDVVADRAECNSKAVSLDSVSKSRVGTRRGRITIDSGAAESVMPPGEVPEIPIKESEGHKKGINYVAANGSKMPNLGEKSIKFNTRDGTNSGITFQITHARKPLASVSKIVQKGNCVTFSPNGSFIQNVRTGRKIDIEEANGTYFIDVEYILGDRGEAGGAREGFTRQA